MWLGFGERDFSRYLTRKAPLSWLPSTNTADIAQVVVSRGNAHRIGTLPTPRIKTRSPLSTDTPYNLLSLRRS